MSTNERPADEVEQFGTAPAIRNSGDLVVNSLNRLSFRKGRDTVEQRLKVTFLTPRGFDPMDPEFGFDVFVVGESDDVVKAEARRVCEHDPDVAAVESIEITHPEVSNRPSELNIVVQLESGGQLAFETQTPA